MSPLKLSSTTVLIIDVMAGALSGQNVSIRVRGEVATLVNIEYPGRIVNPEKAMKTLGGVKELSQVCSSVIQGAY